VSLFQTSALVFFAGSFFDYFYAFGRWFVFCRFMIKYSNRIVSHDYLIIKIIVLFFTIINFGFGVVFLSHFYRFTLQIFRTLFMMMIYKRCCSWWLFAIMDCFSFRIQWAQYQTIISSLFIPTLYLVIVITLTLSIWYFHEAKSFSIVYSDIFDVSVPQTVQIISQMLQFFIIIIIVKG